ncbi:cytochrome-c oxidase, cbb3-type subunit III [Aquabacterium soli]|uniref:Cbb3-type cytochrome c oxidase subunit n=1 Tax=Aquabacterium soli TaxID=2493092 RepID=A0A3R8YJQ5_9BURK|nr:cytochrome-c oxidase, cbb3-type subunit III [Aquabacterium soli]RRS01004.1 cytochrome-c oxidase, cbb3-type subunit III [Aquabacterium soli]
MSDFVSNGWHLYVTAIVIGGLLFCVLVLVGSARHKVIRDAKGNIEETTGHVWDGDLRELNNPLPRWWVGLFVLTIVYAVIYLVMYPGVGANAGTLGWTSVKEYHDEVLKAKVAEDKVYAGFQAEVVEKLAGNPDAQAIGQRLFLNNCAACHGSDARGGKSYPNLTDKDWLHGGTPDKIIETITHGRHGVMPPMAAAVGTSEEVRQLANYVLSLSGSAHNSLMAELGRDKFKACAACHGADGKGNQILGAPNLTDKIWLHGWGEAAIVDIVTKGKTNVMPAQKDRLTADQIKVLASYVWGLSNQTQTAQGAATKPPGVVPQ